MLSLKDFTWVKLGKNDGYYSYRTRYYEICILDNIDYWAVYLCKCTEEVLEEYECDTEKQALKQANTYYEQIQHGSNNDFSENLTELL